MSVLPSDASDSRRRIPAVHQVLAAYHRGGGSYSDAFVTPLIQDALQSFRRASPDEGSSEAEMIDAVVRALLQLDIPKLEPVLNGTGVILHTNLGRAPVSDATARAMADAASGNVALEIDPASGLRGKRMLEIEQLLQGLTGAEAALVVNNNAAAILLVLSTVANGKEVVLSRSEAVEIGGGVRIPDILAQSGARMVEVGTTNRTYVRDYENAIGPESAAILKIHPSNFQITGFVQRASIAELAVLAHARNRSLIEDQGSGLLLDPAPFGLSGDRPASESIRDGADIVTMSGDKLIGGPQAGIIIGKAALVERCARHSLARAVRVDKATLAGVAETLRHYARGEATDQIPIWRMIAATPDALRDRADAMVARLHESGNRFDIIETTSTIGGGSLPGETLPGVAISPAIDAASDIEVLARALRMGRPAVYGRVEHNRLLIELRTILPEHDGLLVERLARF